MGASSPNPQSSSRSALQSSSRTVESRRRSGSSGSSGIIKGRGAEALRTTGRSEISYISEECSIASSGRRSTKNSKSQSRIKSTGGGRSIRKGENYAAEDLNRSHTQPQRFLFMGQGDDEILDNDTVKHQMATCTPAGKECSRSNERKGLNKGKTAIKPDPKIVLAGGKKTFR